MKKETVDEFLARGGTIKEVKAGKALGARSTRHHSVCGTRGNSSRGRAYKSMIGNEGKGNA